MEPTSHATDRARRLAELTGERSKTPHPMSVTAIGGGGKFTPEGTPLPFPGNTFLCHVDKASAAYGALSTMQDRLRALPSAPHFAFLPKPSFHMTVFGGVCGAPLGWDGWPSDLRPGTPLAEVTNLFVDRLRGHTGAQGVRMRAARCDLGTSIHLVAHDPESGETLRRLRGTLRDATGLDREDHDAYAFHVTLSYQTRWLDAADAPAHLDALDTIFADARDALDPIELGPVEICEFETMEAFQPVASFGHEGVGDVVRPRVGEAVDRGAAD